MKQIKLECRDRKSRLKPIMYALVDDLDFDFLTRFEWKYVEDHKNFYAYTYFQGKTITMHCFLFASIELPPNCTIDHKNGNGLDNQRDNLRFATRSQQRQNAKKRKGCSSQYIGVSLHRKLNKWKASIVVNQSNNHLGLFTTEIAAAKVYNKAAIRLFGTAAKLNNVVDVVLN